MGLGRAFRPSQVHQVDLARPNYPSTCLGVDVARLKRDAEDRVGPRTVLICLRLGEDSDLVTLSSALNQLLKRLDRLLSQCVDEHLSGAVFSDLKVSL